MEYYEDQLFAAQDEIERLKAALEHAIEQARIWKEIATAPVTNGER